MNKERNTSLDITRIIAVLAVLMLHTSGIFITLANVTASEYMWGNILNSMSRLGVPLFLMISGALMLDENKDIHIKDLFCKNIKNIVCLFLFWSALYCCLYKIVLPLITGEPLNLLSIISSLLLGHYHMWYLLTIIGLYLMTPFLRAFVKKKNKHLVLLFITISLLTHFTLPILSGVALVFEEAALLISFINSFHLGFFSSHITYYLIGWYLTQIEIKRRKPLYCLGALSLLLTIVYVQLTKDHSNGHSNNNLFVFLYAISVFTALNCDAKWNINIKTKHLLEVLSKLSFGVYIIHPLFQSILSRVFVYERYPFMYILCYWAILVVLSFTGCYIASKLPLIRKLVRA